MHEDPYPTYARLRAEAPVYRSDEFDFWALSRHEDVLAAFRNVDAFSNAYGVSLDPSAFSPDAHRTMSFLALDPPRHTRMRSLVGKGFTPTKVNAMEDRIREITLEHLEPALESGSFDFIADFAGKVPMDVISELVGVPVADRAELRRLADLVLHRDDGVYDVPPEGMEAALDLVVYYQAMVDERRTARRDDLTSALLDAEIDGDRLTDEEIVAFLFLMVVAGNETTTKLLGNAWYWGWRNPDQRAKPFADPPGVPDWVEETLRYDTSSQMLLRVTRQPRPPARHDDRRGRARAAAGRVGQPGRAVFADPDRYDLDRDTRALVSFGSGRHFCMGAPLARLEARIALTELVSRVATYDVDPDGIERVHSINVRGLAALPTTVALALMPRFPPNPDRRPAVVTGASSGIGRATAVALAALGHPVVLGARRVDECEEAAVAIHAEGGEAVAIRLDLADDDSVEQFASAAVGTLGEVEIVVSNAGKNMAGGVLDTDPASLDDVLAVNVTGTHRLVRALLPDMVSRRRGDVVFVTSDVAERPRPTMAAYVTSKWGLEGYVHSLQMELEGTGRAGHHPAPGADHDRHGDGLGPGGDRRDHRAVGRLGLRPPRQLHAPRRGRPGRLRRGGTAPGGPRHRHRAATRGAHRATGQRARRPVMAVDTGVREPARVSGGEGATGHLEELRADPIGLMERVRSECGDAGVFRLADRDVILLSGAEANEFFFRAPEEVLDQAEAYPFMTPVFGEGVVFDASPERRREMLHNQALARQVHAGPRHDHRRRGRAHGGRLGRRGRVRHARVVRRAVHLHLLGLPGRPALPGAARRAVRHALPRPRAGHRRHRLRRPLRRHRELPTPRRGTGRAGDPDPGDHGPPRRRAARPRRRARPARRPDVDQEPRRHRPVAEI